MSEKPTQASVTGVLCTCGYLQRAAEEPDNPIRFDGATAEYQFVYGDAMLVIYHCPFCGGAAPPSQRERLFAVIPRAETERLAELLAPVKTIDDALRRLGEPELDSHLVGTQPEQDGAAPRVDFQRQLTYSNLSDVARVCIIEREDGGVYWILCGKPLESERGA